MNLNRLMVIAGGVLSAILIAATPAVAISGGEAAAPGEFPWMVRLDDRCGGTLIHPQLVLTAGHCVEGAAGDSLTITSGTVDLEDPNRTLTSSIAIIGEEEWWEGPDWAVVKLAEPLDLPTLALATTASDLDTLTVTGWGKTIWEGPQQRFLQKVEMPFLPDDQCFAPDSGADYPASFLCAKSENQKSHCGGDSGGPALHKLPDGTWEQVGIVSSGSDCDWEIGEEPKPCYTDVAYFTHQIHQAVEDLLTTPAL